MTQISLYQSLHDGFEQANYFELINLLKSIRTFDTPNEQKKFDLQTFLLKRSECADSEESKQKNPTEITQNAETLNKSRFNPKNQHPFLWKVRAEKSLMDLSGVFHLGEILSSNIAQNGCGETFIHFGRFRS